MKYQPPNPNLSAHGALNSQRFELTDSKILEPYTMNTIVVAAKTENFDIYFMEELTWFPVRIDSRRISSLKWIAVYQGTPIQAITHFAKIDSIKVYKDTSRYIINFFEPEELKRYIPLGSASTGYMQSQRYTTLDRLKSSSEIREAFI